MPAADRQSQRQFAIEIVRTLRDRGYEAYFAGGCVRDQLLGLPPKDYDVATSARPEEIRTVFGKRRTLAIGAAFGVITVLGPGDAGQIDVATFREDVGYSDGRRPDAITFTTPQADAQRRDFTINGLFFDPLDDRVLDFVAGQADLAQGIVRAIGDPRARFTEDKLRLLRGVRFAGTYGFSLEAATRAAIVDMAPQVTVVSVERIAAEMQRMLCHPRRRAAVELLADSGLLAVILPEVASEIPAGDGRWASALDVLERLGEPSFALALAALLHQLVHADLAAQIGRRWKLSNRDLDRVEWLVGQQQSLCDAREQPWSRLQPVLAAPGADELLALSEAIANAAHGDTADLDFCRAKLAQPREVLDSPPLLTGDDLKALGVTPGPRYQQLLSLVRDAQLDAQIVTQDEALALVKRALSSEN